MRLLLSDVESYVHLKNGKGNAMSISFATLKERAAAAGAELFFLRNGKKLPDSFRGKTGHKLWLCVPRKMNRRALYALICRFDEIRFFVRNGE